jgi:hypothetical protein
MTDRVRALLITPDDDLLAIQQWVMSTTLADTPAATSRNAATSEPGTAGRALGATPATSPAPAGAVPAAPALPGGSATRCRRPGRAATFNQSPGLTCCAGFSTACTGCESHQR